MPLVSTRSLRDLPNQRATPELAVGLHERAEKPRHGFLRHLLERLPQCLALDDVAIAVDPTGGVDQLVSSADVRPSGATARRTTCIPSPVMGGIM